MLNNPTALIYQNFKMSIDDEDGQKPEKKSTGLLGPRQSVAQKPKEDSEPSSVMRVASYMKLIQEKRQGI